MAARATGTLKGATQIHVIPAGRGFAFAIKAGSQFMITDLHGQQVVDMMWFLDSLAPPSVGQYLYSNHAREMFKVVEDTVKVHDMQYMACNPGLYARIGKPEHRSCASNFAEAMTTYLRENGDKDAQFEWFQVHDPFNTFQNTPYYTMKGWMDSSKAGDYIKFQAEMDCVVALSCCPYEEGGFNGGKSTEVAVTWQID
ncbi:hypothetical protein FANTH_4420 [Fusarium anthophilum]|uniref:DUF1989 domain-containing protein n=1 Tax=Fusarium anthophilum TaxID=48485 RepID=A0A8H5E873_9HYPO|nr:hypothetical protein FANTH_4420 [Fusarium anthophilum]